MSEPSSAGIARLWREEGQRPLPLPQQPPPRTGRMCVVGGLMLALTGVFTGLLFWLRAEPNPLFLPLWVTEQQARQFPPAPWAAQDRAELTALFSHQRAPSAQDRHLLLHQLVALAWEDAGDAVVVYLGAQGIREGPGKVAVVAADANPDDPGTRLPLGKVLELLRECPARHRLLILDVMRPLGDPRLGILNEDVAGAVQAEVAAAGDPNLLVLCACAPGQTALTSAALGRSVFAWYVEQGLRGRADGWLADGRRDGHVSVRELAAFVRSRVDRWAVRNRDSRQTPVLLGNGKDFLMRNADPVVEAPTPGEVAAYPAWLLEGWKQRDQAVQDGSWRLAPRLRCQQEAFLLRAEAQWRGGVDPAQVRGSLKQALLQLQKHRAEIKPPLPEARSLAQAVALGERPDEALTASCKEVLAQLPALQGLKAEEAAKARAKLGEELQAKLKGKSAFAVAWSAVELAATDGPPSADQLRLLDGLLPRDRPAYVETLLLRALAGQPGPPEMMQRLLEAGRRGEEAAASPRAFPWVAALLEQAAQDRHDGEVCFWARGYAALAQADSYLKKAAGEYGAILSNVRTVEEARAVGAEALALLPAYLPYLDAAPEAEAGWQATAAAAGQVFATLVPPARVDAALLSQRLAQMQQYTAAVKEGLQALHRPFAAENLSRLEKLCATPDARPALLHEIDGLLGTPLLKADERAALWKAGATLARRLAAGTLALDQEEDEAGEPATGAVDFDERPAVLRQEENARRRARTAVGLLKLGGLVPASLGQLEASLDKLAKAPAQAADWAALSDGLRQALGRQLFEQLDGESSPYVRDRLSRVLPPFDALRLVDEKEVAATAQRLAREAKQLFSWQADRCRYQARDFRDAGLSAALASSFGQFYTAAADLYQQVGRPAPETYLQFSGGADLPRLTAANPKAKFTLAIHGRLAGKAAPPCQPVMLENPLFAVYHAATSARPKGTAATPAADGSWALCVELKAGTGRPPSPRPRGFLVEARLGDRSFHHKVDVAFQAPGEEPHLLLSADAKDPGQDLQAVRVRPGKVRQPYYLFLHNPDDRPRKLSVRLLAGDAPLKGAQAALTVPAGATVPVRFGEGGPSPKDDLPSLQGPLVLELSDSESAAVLDTTTVPVDIASPREYVQVSEIHFDPGKVPGKNLLSVTVQTVRPVAGPDIPVELVLPADRLPFLRAAPKGTFTGTLTARPAKGPASLTLYARDMKLAPAADENGYIYLNVDGYARAFLFRTTFARQGEPVTPRGDGRPAVRFRLGRYVPPGPQTHVGIEVDNAPTGATLEFALGRKQGEIFTAESTRKLPSAREHRIGLSPQGPARALLFQASIQDWSIVLDTSKILGDRFARARLLDENGTLIQEVMQPLTVDDTRPEGVRLVGLPEEAQKGTTLLVRATAEDPESGIDKVLFFVGRPEDDKVPPKTVLVPGRRSGLTWSARLPLPDDRKGPTPISVQVVNRVGLHAFATGSIVLLDTDPRKTGPGRITGIVLEGPREQPDLEVILRDLKGAEKGKTKTKADGTFVFEGLAPGKYRVFSFKPASQRRGSAEAAVEPRRTTDVRIELSLVPSRTRKQ
jgi:hypothetical protein